MPEVLKDFHADETYRISARTGQGLDELLTGIGRRIRESRVYLEHVYPYNEAAKIALIRKRGQVIEEEYREDGIYIRAYVDRRGNYV